MSKNAVRFAIAFLLVLSSGGALFGNTSITASPSTVTFSYATGATTAVAQTVQLTSPTTTTFTASFSPASLGYYVTTSGNSTNGTLTVTLAYPQYFSTASTGSLILTPTDGTVNALTIPLVFSPGTSGTIIASPSSLTFSYASGSTTTITQYVTLSAASSVTLTPSMTSTISSYLSIPSSISSNGQFAVTLPYPQNVTSTVTGYLVLAPPSGSGLASVSIPITISPTSSTSGITASPSSLTYSFTSGSTTAITQYVQLSAATSATVTMSLSTELASYFSVTSSATSNSQISVTLASPQYYTSTVTGYLTVTPTSGSGLSALTIPITVGPSSTTSTLTASPSSLTYSFTSSTTTAITQYLTITSSSTVALTPSFSSNLSPYFTISSTVTTNSQFAVTLASPSYLVGGATGYLTLTPPSGSGISAISVPINVNSTSTSTGAITATPSTLTFTGPLNGTAPATQSVTLVAVDSSSQFITVNASSTNNFLYVTQGSFTTPSTLIVRVDPTAISSIGTYTGYITVSLSSGSTAATIPVTYNVINNVTVTPSPSSVSLTAASGATTSAQGSVILTTTNSALSYGASVSYSSGSGWLTVSPASGTLGGTLTVNASPTYLSTGTYSATITITSQSTTVATIPVTFTVTTAAAIQLSSTSLTFNYQTTATSLPAAQTVTVSSSGASMTWNASATSSGNWLSVSPASGTTGNALTVSVSPASLSANTYTGMITVTSANATNSPQTITVTLKVTTPATPVISSVLNAASLVPSMMSPGEIITIKGTDLGPTPGISTTVDSSGYLATTLSTTKVLFDGTAVPLLYASATQINAIAPYEIANRTTTKIVVQANSQSSQSLELKVADTAPGLFTSASSGSGQGSIVNQNGTINSSTNPESRGNVVALYGTGHGQTSPAGITGVVYGTSPLRTPTASVTVWIGGQQADVLWSGSAPLLAAGATQINVRIPQTVGTGSLPVIVQFGNYASQSGVTIAVQ